MEVFDFNTLKAFPYAERDKNVLVENEQFKVRIIELPAGGQMPVCEMAEHVLFYVVRGAAEVNVNGARQQLAEGQCLVTGPATLSMRTEDGVKIYGVQIRSGKTMNSSSEE